MEETVSYKHFYKPIEDLPQPVNAGYEYLDGIVMRKPEMMRDELLRLMTFSMFPRENKPDILSIAVAGFYHGAASGDAVTCYGCGLTVRFFTASVRPLEIHKLLSKECPFIKENSRVNRVYFQRNHIEKELLQSIPRGTTTGSFQLGDTATSNDTEIEQLDQVCEPQVLTQAGASENRTVHIGTFHFPNQAEEIYNPNQPGQFFSVRGDRRFNLEPAPNTDKVTIETSCNGCDNESVLEAPTGISGKLSQGLMLFEDGENFVDLRRNPTKSTCVEHLDMPGERELGRGGFGKCYKVVDKESYSFKAMKQIPLCGDDQEKANDVWREFQLAQTLCHPNIVRTFRAIFDATDIRTPKMNIYMDFIAGGSVADLIRNSEIELDDKLIKHLIRQVLYGLHYLHSRKILHRDIKGANLLLDSTGENLKICDFGAATEVDSTENGNGEKTVKLIGTVPFMAPEVVRYQHYTASGDIWSVGCCIIEMATRMTPWNIDNQFTLIFKIGGLVDSPDGLNSLTEPLRHKLSLNLERLMLSCLTIAKNERPSAHTLLNDEYLFEEESAKYFGNTRAIKTW